MKKILKKVLQNRLVAFGLILAVELVWLVIFVTRLASYSTMISVIFTVISLLAVLWIINRDDNPAYKVAWIILIMALPILGGLFSILLMDYVVGPLLGGLQSYLVEVFAELQAGPRVVFGLVMGAMMGVDFGGPVTKIATTVANGLVADGVLGPEGAKVCCGIVPALGLGIATFLFPKKFTKAERATGPSAIVLGCAQVGEGGLPYLLRDPLHVMPAGIAGSAVTGAIAMFFNVGSPVMMGGFFAFPVMQNIFPGAFIAVAAGVIVEILLVALIKKTVTGEDELDELSGLDDASVDDDFDISIEEG